MKLVQHGCTDAWYHLLDASWAALLMLCWYEELDADDRLLAYSRTYAEHLLTLQDEQGFLPSWLHPETLAPSAILAPSPQSSMSVTFLLKLAELTGDPRYRQAALRAMDAVDGNCCHLIDQSTPGRMLKVVFDDGTTTTVTTAAPAAVIQWNAD